MITEYRHPDDTVAKCLAQLSRILNTVPSKLRSYTTDEFSRPQVPGKWSKKQIIGHLIDSATNNHHRFVRAQFEDKPSIQYHQEHWNEHGHYTDMDGPQLIDFWEQYNRHLIELIKRISPSMMDRPCSMSDGSTRSLSWIFEDYVRHMEHHLRQIMEYQG